MTPKHSMFVVSSRQPFLAELDRAMNATGGKGQVRIAGRIAFGGAAAPACVEALHSGSANVVLLDLDSGAADGFRILEEMIRLQPDVRVLVASSDRDPDLILRVVRAGAADFVGLPLQREPLMESLSRAARRGGVESGTSAPRGRVMAFLGAKGGCGATSVAVNLAATLCAPQGGKQRSVILLDLDTPGGDVAAMLKMKPSYTLADVASNLHRLDTDLLNSMAMRHESGLMCLSISGEGTVHARLTPNELGGIVAFLRDHFDDVVVAGGSMDDTQMAALNLAHMVHLVTTLDFLSLRRAHGIITRLREFGVHGDAMRVVVNKVDKGSDLTTRDARQALDSPVVWSIPEDSRTAARAVNEGIIYAATGKNRLQAAFEEYASLLAGDHASTSGSGSVGRLFRRLVPGRVGMPA